MSATISKSYAGDTGAEMWFIRAGGGYETFIIWGADGPDGGAAEAFATRKAGTDA
jgi:hypothetical protein